MSTESYRPLLHRFAVATLLLALLPIVVGAMVTTLDAGMAFRDWPSSDGHNMFFYPWLKSAGDKFIEHGHRLAGALIGVVAIGLAVVAWRTRPAATVQWCCYGVLFAVIAQGLLGGSRVRLDARTLAMVHGSFAALVFCLMACTVVITGKGWSRTIDRSTVLKSSQKSWSSASLLTTFLCLAVFGQYLLGGLVRHLGLGLHEHLAGAVFVTCFTIATGVLVYRLGVPQLQKIVWLVFGCLALQVSLGLGAWVMKFGFAPAGYVAVVNSLPQILFRTAHTVSGMFLLAATVALRLQVARHTRLVFVGQDATESGQVVTDHAFGLEGRLQ